MNTIARSPLLMSRNDTALFIVDVQEKLIPLIPRNGNLIWNCSRLIRAAKLLGMPVAATEQYPKGLGHTVGPLKRILEDEIPEKVFFSCRECEHLIDDLEKKGVRKIVLAGIETHVCVQQTALDFLSHGLDIYLAVDAVGSRNAVDSQTAIRRMESCGVNLVTTEAAMFEWCESSRAAEFKEISKLVQEKSPPDIKGIG